MLLVTAAPNAPPIERMLAFMPLATPVCPGGTATNATEPVAGPHLSFSPGRVDPENPVWDNSRKPLAAEFRYRGKPLFVIGITMRWFDDIIFDSVAIASRLVLVAAIGSFLQSGAPTSAARNTASSPEYST